MTWAPGPWLGVDTESSGVDPLTARIVTACVAYRSESDSGWTRAWLADAGHELIPEQATAIHGVTTERAHAEGQPVSDVAEEVRELLVKAWENGVPVVAMNAAYDLSLLNAELVRAGHRELSIDGPVLDPFVLDKMADQYRRGSRRLPDLCAHYNVAHTAAAPGEDRDAAAGAHDATADALAAVRVLWRIGQKYPDLAALSAQELHELQITAKAEQALSLTGYWRSIGKGETADGDWPIRRVAEVAST
jgi:DNA polymerase III subunit epsilon